MPGTKGATGYPKKHCCRARLARGVCLSYRFDVTGKTRKGSLRGVGTRSTDRRIQVRCLDCNSLGWSQHIDAERAFRRRFPEAP